VAGVDAGGRGLAVLGQQELVIRVTPDYARIKRLARLGIDGQLANTLCSTNPCESMIEIVRYTHRDVKRRQQATCASAGPPPACSSPSRQFRRIIGYRDLAKLVIAIERHTLTAPKREARRIAEPAPA
jgi:hypothetical protein